MLRTFIIRVTVFLLLLAYVAQLLGHLTPRFLHTATYGRMLEFFKERQSAFNVVFLGSSHILRNVIPLTFDRQSTHRVQSFNLSEQGMNGLEQLYLYKDLLRNGTVNGKYVVVELCPVDTVAFRLRQDTPRARYFVDTTTLVLALDITWAESHHSFSAKAYYSSLWGIRYLERLYGIGLLGQQLRFIANPAMKRKGFCGKHNRGYCNLERMLRGKFASEFRARRRYFLEHLPNYQKKWLLTQKAIASEEMKQLSLQYLQTLRHLVEDSEKQGIRIVFYLPPPLDPRTYKELYPIFRRLDTRRRIDLADPRRYPEFYRVENLFDGGHLNNKGAVLLSMELARQFDRIVVANGWDIEPKGRRGATER